MKSMVLFLIVLSVIFAPAAMAGEVIVNGFSIGPTARGHYTITCWPPAGSEYCPATITFPGRVASAPSVVIWIPQGSPPTGDCAGSSTNPTATPGTLCIYEQTKSNVSSRLVCGLAECPGVDNFGTVLWVSSTTAGYTTSQGSWAFTPYY